jgi:hypothetical protein
VNNILANQNYLWMVDSSTLQNILTVISNLEQPVDKNKIAQELILKGNYKSNLHQEHYLHQEQDKLQ